MNTYGWDVVYVNTISRMNKQIKKYMDENEIIFRYVDENTSITLIFDNWEIVSGGSGKLLRMKTLVKEGKLVYKGSAVELNRICPLLEIQLGFLHESKRSNTRKLTFNFLQKGTKEGDQREGAVTVINPDINNVFPEEDSIYDLLKIVLADMFIENKEKLSYTFAELNVSPDSSWMKPEKYKYSYYHPTSSDKGLLTIFSVVTNRDISKLDELIDGAVIDDQNDSFLVLSESLFLEHIIMPELPNSFGHGATINDFQFENTSPTSGFIKNTKNLNRAPIHSTRKDHYPIITTLHVKIEGNKLYIKYSGKCPITGGPSFAYVKFAVEEKYIIDYDSFNKKILFTLEDGSSKVNVERVGLNNVVPLYKFILTELADNLSKAIQMNIKANISTFKTDVVKWSGMDLEEITDCVLNVALCIKGKVPNVISGDVQIVTALNNTSVVDVSSEKHGDVHLWDNHGGNNQKWRFEYDDKKKAYQIKSVSDVNLVLAWIDVPGSRKVMAHRNEYKDEHYWVLQELKGDYYIIKNKKNRDLVLDVDGAKIGNGTNIKVNEQHSLEDWLIKAQTFKLKKV
ncbi:TULIP family P47-like protein [Bacillus cereus group sp. Bc222]|uniref:TULIP family P47-like protein n=1 Tax=Bacillus cereus group sp. Bc222 TaxID=3018111 RepID=UPI0022E3552E|nr:TULIP family P47-like protein [Bacillus cereus group sp. Bc222]MDA2241744.1 TULIP family P47-like protein [Bacillus cereus group sp. Bc222]